ncbi:RNA polymerase III RPC4-domain-containing protein [Talaromyces proteolyticus]|uniref:RNA polymerase III RPC4-domain-containing protein n=1 Tax=Talaromyces proteolyticus TaxID=1131652 RepID=A0AAD4KTP9_9EURO|nr:RNA polymerase III RPC4-domain-containing protein [Talaromyces proteolyticus]KAH8696675.1 RNA polymerase III RPC4-domain-containing protein [Talaromyces proteolyticus]
MPPKAAPSASRSTRKTATSSAQNDEQNAASQPATDNTPSNPLSGRPPVQRLQSLNKRTPGGSISNRASIGLGDPSQSKPELKYKPRAANRRTKEARDAILKLEEERQRQRLADAAEIQRSRMPRAPRARGGFRGRGGSFMQTSGPMSMGAAKRGRGGRFEVDSHVSSVSRRSMSGLPGTTGGDPDLGYSSDEDEHAARVSIDQINLDDDDLKDGDDIVVDKKGKKAVKSSHMSTIRVPLPVRVPRHEHEERVVGVNTEASSSTSAELRRQAKEKANTDGSLFVDEAPGAVEKPEDDNIKPEPTDGDVSMTDVPHVGAETADEDETPLPMQIAKARKKVTVKDPRGLLRTREDIEEFDRHNEDLRVMKGLLTLEGETTSEKKKSETEGVETNGAQDPKESLEEEEPSMEKNAGELFLIQFPPLTPNLVVPGTGEPVGSGNQPGIDDDDVAFTHSNATLGEPEVKREDGDEPTRVSFAATASNPLVTATERALPAGRVGRLNLHKSGRVTLDWGGISFELDKGADVNFVQEALIASKSPEVSGEKDNTEEKCVWAMGQLSGKFVASPEWNSLL